MFSSIPRKETLVESKSIHWWLGALANLVRTESRYLGNVRRGLVQPVPGGGKTLQ